MRVGLSFTAAPDGARATRTGSRYRLQHLLHSECIHITFFSILTDVHSLAAHILLHALCTCACIHGHVHSWHIHGAHSRSLSCIRVDYILVHSDRTTFRNDHILRRTTLRIHSRTCASRPECGRCECERNVREASRSSHVVRVECCPCRMCPLLLAPFRAFTLHSDVGTFSHIRVAHINIYSLHIR